MDFVILSFVLSIQRKIWIIARKINGHFTVIFHSFSVHIERMLSERDYITRFRASVERQFLLGNKDGKLRQRDFEYLAKLIEEKSRVRLSLSTLKRLWKNDHTQEPHPATLDAMASLLGFDSWQTFKTHQQENP